MKEKIKKLLLGCKEDALIGLNLLLEHYNPQEFIKEWARDFYEDKMPYDALEERYGLIPGDSKLKNEMFYYRVNKDLYILIRVGVGLFVCFNNYLESIEVINHK